VIGLGKSLGIATTEEGVENDVQRELLRREGCTQAQGFLFRNHVRCPRYTSCCPLSAERVGAVA
jgi:EAL domain-containing protein (putative c-di-GMP-specific phosphodiesterase class I)